MTAKVCDECEARKRDECIVKMLARIEKLELERDAATNIVENEQGRAVMYIGKYETELKEKEKLKARVEKYEHMIRYLAGLLAAADLNAENTEEYWLARADEEITKYLAKRDAQETAKRGVDGI